MKDIREKTSFEGICSTNRKLRKINILNRKDKRWTVIYNEGNWLCGLYRPEFTECEQIKKLEKHDAPEMFLLLDGHIVLVLKDKSGEKKVELKKNEIVIVESWHNAYSPDGKGVALVVEKSGVKTIFANR